MPKYYPIIKEGYILQESFTVNRPPNSPESFVSDSIGRLSELHDTP